MQNPSLSPQQALLPSKREILFDLVNNGLYLFAACALLTSPKRNFGTFENPRYTIGNPNVVNDVGVFADHISDSKKIVENSKIEKASRIEHFIQNVDRAEKEFDKIAGQLKGKSLDRDARSEIHFLIGRLEHTIQMVNLFSAQTPSYIVPVIAKLRFEIMAKNKRFDRESLTHQFGTPEQCARNIFRRITGENLPAGVSVAKGDLPEDHSGQVDELTTKVQISEMDYANEVMTISHEFGHLITMHSDDSRIRMLSGEQLKVSNTLEETGAYLFQASACNAVEDPSFALLMKTVDGVSRLSGVIDFLNGQDTLHSRASAVCDALITLNGKNPALAFMKLSRMREAPTAVWEHIAKLKKDWQVISNDPLTKQAKQIASKATILADKMRMAIAN